MKRVRLGKRTVKDGEACVIWDRFGKSRLVEGPSLEYLFYSIVQFLDLLVAESNEYLEIHFSNGSVENIPGPAAMFRNPVVHSSVLIKNAVKLNCALDVAVLLQEPLHQRSDSVIKPEQIMKSEIGDDKMYRGLTTTNLIHGPCLVFPKSNERFVSFFDSTHPCVLYLGSSVFPHKIPVSTSDGLDVVVTISCTFKICNVEKFLLGNQDPKVPLVSGISANVRNILSAIKSSKFIETDGILTEVCGKIQRYDGQMLQDEFGILVERIECHGIDGFKNEMTAKLKQELHHQQNIASILNREQLTIADEKNAARLHEIEENKLRQQNQLAGIRLEEELKRKRDVMKLNLEYLQSLKDLDVDLTQVFVRREEPLVACALQGIERL